MWNLLPVVETARWEPAWRVGELQHGTVAAALLSALRPPPLRGRIYKVQLWVSREREIKNRLGTGSLMELAQEFATPISN